MKLFLHIASDPQMKKTRYGLYRTGALEELSRKKYVTKGTWIVRTRCWTS